MRSNKAEHPEDYDRSGFPIPMMLPEVATFLGVDRLTAEHLMIAHRVPRSGTYGGFNRPAVRTLREVLIASGKLSPMEEEDTEGEDTYTYDDLWLDRMDREAGNTP